LPPLAVHITRLVIALSSAAPRLKAPPTGAFG
jgi:hypothetical protein